MSLTFERVPRHRSFGVSPFRLKTLLRVASLRPIVQFEAVSGVHVTHNATKINNSGVVTQVKAAGS